MIVPKDRSVGLTDTVRLVACGAAEAVPLIRVVNLARCLKQLKSRGIWLMGTTDAAGRSLYDVDLTGPLGFWNAPRLVGIQDAIEYINEKKGGIAGRKVFLEWVDTKSKIDIATSGYERLKEKGFPVWHTCGTGEQQILKARYEKDKSQVVYTCSTSPNVRSL